MISEDSTFVFLKLDPTKAVGPFTFGAEAQPLIERYGLLRLDDPISPRSEWDTYECPMMDVQVYVENGRIDRVGCFRELYHEEQNLIGLTLDQFRARFGEEEEVGDDLSGKTPLEFFRHGLQVWIKDGLVESIMCSEAL